MFVQNLFLHYISFPTCPPNLELIELSVLSTISFCKVTETWICSSVLFQRWVVRFDWPLDQHHPMGSHQISSPKQSPKVDDLDQVHNNCHMSLRPQSSYPLIMVGLVRAWVESDELLSNADAKRSVLYTIFVVPGHAETRKQRLFKAIW